jgi:hypothetical protein
MGAGGHGGMGPTDSRLSFLFGAPSPRRAPRVSPARPGFSIGKAAAAETRPLPNALPAGAPLDNVWTQGAASFE